LLLHFQIVMGLEVKPELGGQETASSCQAWRSVLCDGDPSWSEAYMKTLYVLNEAITNHPFFRGMRPEHLAVLAEGAKAVQFKPGDVLFREGEPASQFYLIERGRIALEAHEPADGTTLVQTLGAGDVLGWSWLFPPFAWHLQARAIEPASTIALNGAHLLVTAERDHEFGCELMKRVAQVVIRRLQATRRQLLALQIEPALEG
jgi:CRP-like cAMP-binding protein